MTPVRPALFQQLTNQMYRQISETKGRDDPRHRLQRTWNFVICDVTPYRLGETLLSVRSTVTLL